MHQIIDFVCPKLRNEIFYGEYPVCCGKLRILFYSDEDQSSLLEECVS